MAGDISEESHYTSEGILPLYIDKEDSLNFTEGQSFHADFAQRLDQFIETNTQNYEKIFDLLCSLVKLGNTNKEHTYLDAKYLLDIGYPEASKLQELDQNLIKTKLQDVICNIPLACLYKVIEHSPINAKEVEDVLVDLTRTSHPLVTKTRDEQKGLKCAVKYLAALHHTLVEYQFKIEDLKQLLNVTAYDLDEPNKKVAHSLLLRKYDNKGLTTILHNLFSQILENPLESSDELQSGCQVLKDMLPNMWRYTSFAQGSITDTLLCLCKNKDILVSEHVKFVLEEFINFCDASIFPNGLGWYQYTETQLSEFIKVLPANELTKENNPVEFSFGLNNGLNIYQQLLEKIQSRIREHQSLSQSLGQEHINSKTHTFKQDQSDLVKLPRFDIEQDEKTTNRLLEETNQVPLSIEGSAEPSVEQKSFTKDFREKLQEFVRLNADNKEKIFKLLKLLSKLPDPKKTDALFSQLDYSHAPSCTYITQSLVEQSLRDVIYQISLKALLYTISRDTKLAEKIAEKVVNLKQIIKCSKLSSEDNSKILQNTEKSFVQYQEEQSILESSIRYLLALQLCAPTYKLEEQNLKLLLRRIISDDLIDKKEIKKLLISRYTSSIPLLVNLVDQALDIEDEFDKNLVLQDGCKILKDVLRYIWCKSSSFYQPIVDRVFLLCKTKDILLVDSVKEMLEVFIELCDSEIVDPSELGPYKYIEDKLVELIDSLPPEELNSDNNPVGFSFGLNKGLNIYQQLLEKIQSRIRDYQDKSSESTKQLAQISLGQDPTPQISSKVVPDAALKQEGKTLNKILNETKQLNPHLSEEDIQYLLLSYEAVQMASEDISSIIQDNKPKGILRFIDTPTPDINGGIEEFKYSEPERQKSVEILKSISGYNEKDINQWARTLAPKKASEPEFLPELIAVIKRANFLFNEQTLRDTQIISILAFFQNPSKGMLQEVKTGEGKSTIVSCLAVIWALRGKCVDVITSSKVLAARDAQERAPFFAMFNLTSADNYEKDYNRGVKSCYEKNIVYGSIEEFQFDLLRRDEGMGGRGGRQQEIALIDEVDSMCIDQSGKIARLSTHLAGSIFLGPTYASISFYQEDLAKHVIYKDKRFYYIDGPFEYQSGKLTLRDESGAIIEEDSPEYNARMHLIADKEYSFRKIMRQALHHLLNNKNPGEEVHLPTYLSEFINIHKESWIKNARHAKVLQEGANYIVHRPEANEESKIIPVDFSNTGVILYSTHWSGGLHQFIQIQEAIKIKGEDTMTKFISNLGYLLKYQILFGQTGTLGSGQEQELLKEMYNIAITLIPTFKPKIFHEHKTKILPNQEEWVKYIDDVIKRRVDQGQAVLIIYETIKEAKNAYERLNSQYPEKVRLYCIGNEKGVIDKPMTCGDIIVATNLAGRGTDIKTTTELEEKGGLQVIISFLSANQRVEAQALGRTSRQGKSGSGQLILNAEEIAEEFSISNRHLYDIDRIKLIRDSRESSRLLQNKLHDFLTITLEDKLYEEMIKLRKFLEGISKNEANLSQFDELWGNKLKDIQNKRKCIEETLHFRNKIYDLGFRTSHNHAALHSLYCALSKLMGYKLSSEELQALHVSVLAKKYGLEDLQIDELTQKCVYILKGHTDEDTLQLFADLFERNIAVVTNIQEEIINITSTNTDANLYSPIVLSAFKSRFTEVLYQLLTPDNKFHKLDIKDKNILKFAKEKVRFIFAEVAKSIADEINATIEEFTWSEFNKFKEDVTSKYKSNMIVTNPNYLTIEGVKNRDYNLLLKAAMMNNKFTFIALYNRALFLFLHGGNRNHWADEPDEINNWYIEPAVNALQEAAKQITNYVIPNFEAVVILSGKNADSQLFAQCKARIDILKLCLKEIERAFEMVKRCNFEEYYIGVASIKSLDSFYKDTSKPKTELHELNALGLSGLFELRQFDVPEEDFDFFGFVAMAFLTVVQICTGMYLGNLGYGMLATTAICSGINDFFKTIKVLGGEKIDWTRYFTEKGVIVATACIAAYAGKFLQHLKILPQASSIFTKGSALTMAELGAMVATKYAFEWGTHLAAKKCVNAFSEDIKQEVEDSISSFFDQKHVQDKICDLLAAGRGVELQQVIDSTFKSHQNVLKQVFEGGIKGALSNDQNLGYIGALAVSVSAKEEISAKMRSMLRSIDNAINRLHQNLENAEQFITKYLQSVNCSKEQIEGTIAILHERNVVVNNQIITENIAEFGDNMGLDEVSLNHIEELKSVMRFFASNYAAKNKETDREEHINRIDHFKQTLTNYAVRYIKGQIIHNLAAPVINQASQGLYQEVVQDLKKAANKIFKPNEINRVKLVKQAHANFLSKKQAKLQQQSDDIRASQTSLALVTAEGTLNYAPEQHAIDPTEKAYLLTHNWQPRSEIDSPFDLINIDEFLDIPAQRAAGSLPDKFTGGAIASGGMSYPGGNPPPGSMSFPDQEALDIHRRNIGELSIIDSQGEIIDISALASMANQNQALSNQTAIVPKQDQMASSIVGHRKTEASSHKTNQDNSLLTAGNFGKFARGTQLLLRHGLKTAASSVARASIAEGALALGGAELGGGALLGWPVVAGIGAYYIFQNSDQIIASAKSLHDAYTAESQIAYTKSDFNSEGRVHEISKQEYDSGKSSDIIMARPEYRIVQGPSLEAMGITKPASIQPASAIPKPVTQSQAQTPAAAPRQRAVDDTKPLAIPTPAAARFANVVNISTTFDPIPQEESLPPFVPPHHIPNLNLFQKCPIRLEAREGMREDAKAAITKDMCPIFRGYSNQKLAQTLVDIACGIEFNPIFANVPKHIAGTFQHTHLKDVNEAYSTLCGDRRFKVEEHYSYGKYFDPIGKPRGSTKGMIRVDLRTIDRNKENGDRFEVYDLKTGVIGITEEQLQNHVKNLPSDILYEVRPGGGMPIQIYPRI